MGFMETGDTRPFVFGTRVIGGHFTDRVAETEKLAGNFSHGINTILISPRRMGKTSLVDKVSSVVASDDLRIARMDAFPCRSEKDFMEALATAVIKATSGRLEEWAANARTLFSRLVPRVSFSVAPMTDFSLSFDLSQSSGYGDEVLDLAERIAQEKRIRMVICIDEFQQIGEFPGTLPFQKKLRSAWQKHDKVSYCLFGSKRHLMEKMFQSRSHPFYRFGDMMYLGKISESDWTEYICRRFAATGKSISEDLARSICTATECYSSYVQHLAWLVWLGTGSEATKQDVERGIESLLDSTEPLFIQQTEHLSAHQMNFLRALAHGVDKGFTSKSVLAGYGLGTSANVMRVKKSLAEKDLITTSAPHHMELCDPILGLWLRRRVWREQPGGCLSQ